MSGRKPKLAASVPLKALAAIITLLAAFVVFLMALALVVRLVLG